MKAKTDWKTIISSLKKALEKEVPPAAEQVMNQKPDPFRVLISTMISLRTKDDVTLAASGRLFKAADTPEKIAELTEKVIAGFIYPAGFYAVKSKHIKTAARLIAERGGTVPDNIEELLSLPGVGRKTANLVLSVGFGIPAICVDTHVHRISNRTGWVATRTPEETEQALMKALPERYWIVINGMLVSYGQRICTPLSPRCSLCVITAFCVRAGVTRTR
ncbi:MAG: endonuclease III [Spirochaetales bacterium]|nr:MAG: endonuclease III [Spirochaetales bacterium]